MVIIGCTADGDAASIPLPKSTVTRAELRVGRDKEEDEEDGDFEGDNEDDEVDGVFIGEEDDDDEDDDDEDDSDDEEENGPEASNDSPEVWVVIEKTS